MVYYKVKKQYDNYKKGINDIYVKNELYTQNEVKKQNLNLQFMTKINILKSKIYWVFGIRKAFTNN